MKDWKQDILPEYHEEMSYLIKKHGAKGSDGIYTDPKRIENTSAVEGGRKFIRPCKGDDGEIVLVKSDFKKKNKRSKSSSPLEGHDAAAVQLKSSNEHRMK